MPRSTPTIAAMTRPDRLVLAYAAVTAAVAIAAGPSLWSLGVPTALFALLVADGVVRPGSRVLVPTISRGSRAGRDVALTFDGGPDAEGTPRIAEALRSGGARATFFCSPEGLEAHPEIGRRLADEGHELGHQAVGSAIARVAGSVRELTGQAREPLYRPPEGRKDPRLARTAERRGLTVVTWSLEARDARRSDSRAIADHVLERVRIGDIVRLRSGDGEDVAEVVTLVLEGLAARGLRCVTVSELLAGDA